MHVPYQERPNGFSLSFILERLTEKNCHTFLLSFRSDSLMTTLHEIIFLGNITFYINSINQLVFTIVTLISFEVGTRFSFMNF